MPTYEYQCQTCQRVREEFQQITAAAHTHMECPADCQHAGQQQPVVRLIGTGASLIFKGSGFYQTDYRSESYKKAAKGDTAGDAKPAAKADGAAGAGNAASTTSTAASTSSAGTSSTSPPAASGNSSGKGST